MAAREDLMSSFLQHFDDYDKLAEEARNFGFLNQTEMIYHMLDGLKTAYDFPYHALSDPKELRKLFLKAHSDKGGDDVNFQLLHLIHTALKKEDGNHRQKSLNRSVKSWQDLRLKNAEFELKIDEIEQMVAFALNKKRKFEN